MKLKKYSENLKLFAGRFKIRYTKKDFNELRKNISKKDIILLSIIPIIATVLMLLPSNLRNSLILNIHNPSWWQFYSFSFVHSSFSAYLNNLGLFLILLFFQIVLIAKMREKKKYFQLILFTALSFPIISSVFIVLTYPTIAPKLLTSSGLSGIISAFLGFIPVLWLSYFSKTMKKKLLDTKFFNIVIFYIALLFSIIYYPYQKNILVILGVLFLLAIFIFSYRKNFYQVFRHMANESRKNTLFNFLLCILPLLFLFTPVILFPTKLIQNGTFIDFIIHYFGIFYGFIVSFIFFHKSGIRKNRL